MSMFMQDKLHPFSSFFSLTWTQAQIKESQVAELVERVLHGLKVVDSIPAQTQFWLTLKYSCYI